MKDLASIKRYSKNSSTTLFLACLLSLFFDVSVANSAGNYHYADGSEGFFSGFTPEPGFYLVNYNYWYTASAFKDDKGKDMAGLDFDVNVWAVAPRFLYFSNKKILGGQYGLYVAIPFYHAEIEAEQYGVQFMNDSHSGVGDIFFSPLILGWHLRNGLHWAFSFDIYAPTGDYESDRPATTLVSKNYWSFQPNLAFTWLTGSGIEVSGKLLFEFHTTNDDYLTPFSNTVEYSPGTSLHYDFAASFPLSTNFRAGLSGFYFTQVEDDKINGRKLENMKAQGLAMGPAFEVTSGNWIISFKQQTELMAHNGPKGFVCWLNVYYNF